jgi:hypothetical protein
MLDCKKCEHYKTKEGQEGFLCDCKPDVFIEDTCITKRLYWDVHCQLSILLAQINQTKTIQIPMWSDPKKDLLQ